MNDENSNLILSKNKRYLIRIDEQAHFSSVGKTFPSQIVGEVVIEVNDVFDNRFSVRLLRLGLVSPGYSVNGEVSTGRISIGAQGGNGQVRVANGSLELDVVFEARVVYEEISRQQGYDWINDHVYATPQEDHEGVLRGRLVRDGKGDDLPNFTLVNGSLQLGYKERGLGLIKSVQSPISSQLLDLLPGIPADQGLQDNAPAADDGAEVQGPDLAFLFNAPAPAAPAAPAEVAAEEGLAAAEVGCPEALMKRRRTLRIHPVLLSSGGALTGGTAAQQFVAATNIWSKACIELDVLANHETGLPANVAAKDHEKIAGLFTSPDVHAICVFFTSDRLDALGGGVTIDGGTGLAKVIITDSVVDAVGNPLNPNLLAHELGHVLHGLHAEDVPMTGWWLPLDADGDTIMTPTGNPAFPNFEKNTLHNCLNADNDALITGTADKCMTPDPS